ncbi:O-antigen polymerase [Clostridium botulinum]|uniref:O-antigen polymerase n=1 Tax=Clostridium botulinum TaxID=1491 RepID=UPI0007733B44|nr:O-antigen polymerase [Clostridium botulinum]NFE95393.1 oligosaccharide repeat unit polymerase [Clostridium botulinum]NFL38234.1 oligosaccharide repeat unit polymerase [Clostridium botulinum]NFN08039.1 oligosaccharide repeat unit polymerase [Clostridium botulinum]NFN24238.1 oligosaccharide repeat unit polymerase [Clostridium botulinum]NFN31342.1 oligosaccharide repeat unit polymerase [Clostridium botulinum]
MLYFLLCVEVILFFIALYIFKLDFASPSVISIFVIGIATFFTIYNIDFWNITYYLNTVIVIVSGLFVMIIAEYLSVKRCGRKTKINNKVILGNNYIEYIYINKNKVIVVVFFDILFTFLYYLEVKRLGTYLGYDGLSAIAAVKDAYMNSNSSVHMNIIIRQSFKLVVASSYIHSFIFINNFISMNYKFKNNIIHIIPIVCASLIIFFSGSRSDIIRIFSAGMLMFCVLWGESRGWRSNFNMKFFKLAIPSVIIFAIVFSSIKSLIKVENISSNNISNMIDYISYYIGSSIQVLNIKIQDGLLGRGSILCMNPNNINEFVYLNRDYHIGGNVATIFSSKLIKYGLVGMIVYIFILYFILGYIYHNKLKGSISSYKRNKLLIVISYFYCIFTMSYYEDCLYLTMNISGLLILLCLYCLYWFYFKLKIEV